MQACKRHGVDPSVDMAPASLATLCPACPQIGINMDPNWEARSKDRWYVHPSSNGAAVLTSIRFVDALFYGIDGNFVANRKDKNTDPDDVPLTKGAAYFADEDDFAKYLVKMGPLKIEVCRQASS